MRLASALLIVGLVPLVALADDDGLPPPPATSYRTSFDPKKDGLPFANVGDYASDGGDCFGMSVVALLRYRARTSGAAPRAEDALSQRALAGVVQGRMHAAWQGGFGNRLLERELPPKDPRAGVAIQRELAKGTPVVAYLAEGSNAHAVVFYGYSGGTFQIYDPNHPGEKRTWSWDAKSGFSSWSLDYGLGRVKGVAVYDLADLGTEPALSDLDALRDSCDELDATCAAHYMPVALTVQKTTRADGSIAYVASATVRGGLAQQANGAPVELPSTAVVYVGGRAVETVTLKAWQFSVTLPSDALADAKEVRLALVGSHGRLAGFAKAPIPSPSATLGVTGALGATGR